MKDLIIAFRFLKALLITKRISAIEQMVAMVKLSFLVSEVTAAKLEGMLPIHLLLPLKPVIKSPSCFKS